MPNAKWMGFQVWRRTVVRLERDEANSRLAWTTVQAWRTGWGGMDLSLWRRTVVRLERDEANSRLAWTTVQAWRTGWGGMDLSL